MNIEKEIREIKAMLTLIMNQNGIKPVSNTTDNFKEVFATGGVQALKQYVSKGGK